MNYRSIISENVCNCVYLDSNLLSSEQHRDGVCLHAGGRDDRLFFSMLQSCTTAFGDPMQSLFRK